MDLTETIAPRSDQQNYDDYLAGSRTVTISAVTKGTAEQPVNLELVEYPGRPYKPNKSMRRVLVSAWGVDSSAYVGRSLTLRGNPDVMWGGKAVGGIEIAALSHIDKPLTINLTVKRGSRAPYVVQPLPAEVKQSTPAPTLEDAIARANRARTKAELRHFYKVAQGLGMDEHTAADLRALDETLPDAEVAQ
jgi:hypothetical protein